MSGPQQQQSLAFTTLCHLLGYAVPYLLPSSILRNVCKALRDEIDNGRFFELQYGTEAQTLTEALLSEALLHPLHVAKQCRLDLPAMPTSLHVHGSMCIVGLNDGEARIVQLEGLSPALPTVDERGREQGVGTIRRRIIGHRSRVTDVSIDPIKILTASTDGTVKMWSTASGQLLKVFEHQLPVQGFRCEEPDLVVLCAHVRGGPLMLHWHDLYTGRPQAPSITIQDGNQYSGVAAGRQAETQVLGAVEWDSFSRRAFVGGVGSGNVWVVLLNEGTGRAQIECLLRGGHDSPVVRMCLQTEQRRLVSADAMGEVAVWRLNASKGPASLQFSQRIDPRACLGLACTGSLLLGSFWGPRLYFLDIDAFKKPQVQRAAGQSGRSAVKRIPGLIRNMDLASCLRHPATCLQIQRRTAAVVVGASDSSLRVITFEPRNEAALLRKATQAMASGPQEGVDKMQSKSESDSPSPPNKRVKG